jgi:hypothetical protein
MIEALITIRDGRVSPVNAAEAEALAQCKPGATYRAQLTLATDSRSSRQSRLWWGFCGELAKNLDGPANKEVVSDILLIEAGHFHVEKWHDGTYRRFAKSISFGKLPQSDFTPIMDRGLAEARKVFGAELVDAVWAEVTRRVDGPRLARAA